MRQLTLCATLRQISGNAAMLGLLLVMPFAIPQAQAAPDQVHLGRQPQAQTAPSPTMSTMNRNHADMMNDRTPTPSQTQPRTAPAPSMSAMNQSGMTHGMSQAQDYSDSAFLSGMLAHHEGAVQMADQLLKSPRNAVNPQVARWAQEIRDAQTEEIMDMQAMLRAVGGLDQAAYQDMKQQMEDMMNQGQGMDPNVRFVALMIPHHASAVEMALPALVYSDSRRIASLAQDIIEDQTEEIMDMRDWLSQQRHSL